ncbi:hypothetical protein RSWS8N_06390 [Cereibacter sphaeroides WS8N]|nr:hypothetical protein RSWS8N_06390 [Cereibacter sphaeroides WS8N]
MLAQSGKRFTFDRPEAQKDLDAIALGSGIHRVLQCFPDYRLQEAQRWTS